MLDANDTLLKELQTPSLRPRRKVSQIVKFKLASCAPGKFLIAALDATNLVPEIDEANNVVIFGPIQ